MPGPNLEWATFGLRGVATLVLCSVEAGRPCLHDRSVHRHHHPGVRSRRHRWRRAAAHSRSSPCARLQSLGGGAKFGSPWRGFRTSGLPILGLPRRKPLKLRHLGRHSFGEAQSGSCLGQRNHARPCCHRDTEQASCSPASTTSANQARSIRVAKGRAHKVVVPSESVRSAVHGSSVMLNWTGEFPPLPRKPQSSLFTIAYVVGATFP